MSMLRSVSLLLAVLLLGSIAEARTALRVCRKACAPMVSGVCPPKGKALRKCRMPILRNCRRQGVAICALAFPKSGSDDGTTTTTLPGDGSGPTSTTVSSPFTTTTLPPAGVQVVAGVWTFDGTVAQHGCSLGASYDTIVSSLSVAQDARALSGAIEGAAASGDVGDAGWTFATRPDCRNVPGSAGQCCLTFAVGVDGFGSPGGADGTASARCDDGSSCEAHWTGTVKRAD
jgi:hypothetical protein